jgi:phage RecT family recombinase
MSNGSQGGAIAIRDADVVTSIEHWAPDHFNDFYQGRNFSAWKQDAALAVIESADLRTAMTTQEGKISLVRALQRSATSGLSLNPQKGESALVPIEGKVNFWPMKNGIIKKALETGALEFIEANTVFSADSFAIKKTARGDDYEFNPALKDRGVPVAYFAVAVLKSGRSVVEYWAKEQVEKHRDRYGKGIDRADSAWKANFDGMAEKTVLKALLTGMHLPQEVARLIEMDNAAEEAVTHDVTGDTVVTPKGTSGDDLVAALADKAGEPAVKLGEPVSDAVAGAVGAKPADQPADDALF